MAERQTKTPRQRAEEAVGVLERRHERLMVKRRAAQEVVTAFDPEIREVEAELRHARQHPALPPTDRGDLVEVDQTEQDPSTTNQED